MRRRRLSLTEARAEVEEFRAATGEDPNAAVIEMIKNGKFSLAGYLAGRAAGERAIILPRDR